MNHTLVVDMNNLIAAGTHNFPKARSADGKPVGGIYHLLCKLRELLSTDPSINSVVAGCDWGVPGFRSTLCPEYKQQRAQSRSPEDEEMYQMYKAQVKYAHRVLRPFGVSCVRARNWEGDDVVAALSLNRLPSNRITILSSDKDFTQLINDRIRLHCPIKRIDRVPDTHYVLKRCMDPKASDNLDGVPGIGEKRADRIVADWVADNPEADIVDENYIQSFISWCESRQNDKQAAAVVANQQKLRANFACTYLAATSAECDNALVFRIGEFDQDSAKEAASQYNMRPVLTDFSSWRPVFSRLVCPFNE